MSAIRELPFVHELLEGRLALEWVPTRMVIDDPSKALGRARPRQLLANRLRAVVSEPTADLVLVSSYFVPTAQSLL
jgi:putative cardiolipin synthase